MIQEALKELYQLDELLHPEGKPWEYWEVEGLSDQWFPMTPEFMRFGEDLDYRRKSTAPHWDQELSPKEVAECVEWPDLLYLGGSENDVIWIKSHTHHRAIWTKQKGWCHDDWDMEARRTLLDHFKKRRQQALLEKEPTEEQLDKFKEIAEKMAALPPDYIQASLPDDFLKQVNKEAQYTELLQRIEALEEKINHQEPTEKPFDPHLGSYWKWKYKEAVLVFILCTPEHERYALIDINDGTRWCPEADTLISAFGKSGQDQLTQITKQEALKFLA